MKGLLIKDILNLKKQYKLNFLMMGFFTVFGYQTGDPSYVMGMIVMTMTMLSITSMSYDDLAKWDNYALSMPISRKSIVKSKYILSILLSSFAIIISASISYVVILPKSNMNTLELLLVASIVFEISLLYSFVILPLIYKHGLEKVRILMVGVFAVPSFIIFLFVKSGVNMPSQSQLLLLLKLSPIFVILVLFVSLNISYRIFCKKDI